MENWQFLFGFKGRIGRGDFWLLMFIAAAMVAAVVIIGDVLGGLGVVVRLAFFIAAFLIYIAASVRRLHDRGRSGWILPLFLGALSALQSVHSDPGKLTFLVFSGGLDSFLDMICLAISIWMYVELGALPGTIGANRYGPTPSAPAPAAPVDGA